MVEKTDTPVIESNLMPTVLPDTIWLQFPIPNDVEYTYTSRYMLFGLEPYAIVGDSLLFKIPVRYIERRH
jgi:hypothetical protein